MTIPGTVEKTSATARSNANSKSPTKAVQIKKPGITVKRKSPMTNSPTSPSTIPVKKNKKSSNVTNKTTKSTASSSPVASFDLEVTLCPICDEACTCPKTTTASSIVVKSPNSKKNEPAAAVAVNKKSKKKSNSKNGKKGKPKYIKKYEISDEESESYEEDSEAEENNSAIVEDPALSFIRMIYSDEESLDEEEAYALYQATQLFSSSSDEEAEFFEQSDSYEEDDSDSESDEEGDFEYTVVEYVQPSKKQLKKSTEFVAYESGDESESSQESQDQSNLLLNAERPETTSDSDDSDSSEEDNWLTYSVFDVDRDLALNHVTGTSSSSSTLCTSLSSHGSGTPDTLLFSTSSTDKIPNIAPQVLAAISAAAKHMANQRSDSNTGGTSKYFSYITLRDPLRGGTTEEVNEEEFLFFEEPTDGAASDSDDSNCSSISDVISDEELEDISVDDSVDVEDDFDSFSEDCSSNESVTEILVPEKKVNKTPTIQTTEYINRWNRVPIGAFRRSRRPSIPAFHHIHPSTALKTFSTDPANFSLSTTAGEDSFDESTATPMERAYSVITWDELDLDITPSTTATTANSSPMNAATHCPLPKRSRSVMLPSTSSNSLVNNFEWLNNNWNWEI